MLIISVHCVEVLDKTEEVVLRWVYVCMGVYMYGGVEARSQARLLFRTLSILFVEAGFLTDL